MIKLIFSALLKIEYGLINWTFSPERAYYFSVWQRHTQRLTIECEPWKGGINSLNNLLEFPLTHSFQDFEKTFRCVLLWFLFPLDKNTRPKSNYFLCYSTQGYGRFTHYFRLNYIAHSGLSSLHSISPQTSSMAELGGAFDTHS